jgi:hypothetical protein
VGWFKQRLGWFYCTPPSFEGGLRSALCDYRPFGRSVTSQGANFHVPHCVNNGLSELAVASALLRGTAERI